LADERNSVFYTISEEKYLEYLREIGNTKNNVWQLLFNEPHAATGDVVPLLCEQYATLFQFEKFLEEIEDSFSAEDQIFYLDQKQIVKLSILVGSTVTVRDELLKSGFSIMTH
jgi:hypothetical protein